MTLKVSMKTQEDRSENQMNGCSQVRERFQSVCISIKARAIEISAKIWISEDLLRKKKNFLKRSGQIEENHVANSVQQQ
jgi:hypothetical protein